MLRLLTLFAVLLFAAFAPVSAPGRSEPTPRRRPRHAAPPRPQARRIPRIPNYPEFAAVAVRHAPLWEITYNHGSPVPYAARNRVTAHQVAVNDVELLDHVLTEYQPPHGVRRYLTTTTG